MLGAHGERNEAAEIRELAQLPGGIALRAQALLRSVGPRHLSRALPGLNCNSYVAFTVYGSKNLATNGFCLDLLP